MPSARVGGGRTSAGEHKGMSPAGAPGPRADGAEELRKRSLLRSHLSPVLFSPGSTPAISSECILRMARGLPPVESERE